MRIGFGVGYLRILRDPDNSVGPPPHDTVASCSFEVEARGALRNS